jgi:sulfoacetaldehyde dehydrogenase
MSSEILELVAKARAAQEQIEFWSQEKVDELVAAVGWEVYQRPHAEACARSAYEETGMGVYEDKVLKHQKKTLGTLRDLHGLKTAGIIEEDPARGLIKIAKPVGVIGSLTPGDECFFDHHGQRAGDSQNPQRSHFCAAPQGQGNLRTDLQLHACCVAQSRRARRPGAEPEESID